ncbi:hypothetical protein V6N11_059159 [Hibiscus sabdariffa]|uniref:RNase H type-1 domain-containing protein n=1 Tax=Hibiscus sabdariffa TaxID=183260 RepID=A0ABR2U6M1_9ROSI
MIPGVSRLGKNEKKLSTRISVIKSIHHRSKAEAEEEECLNRHLGEWDIKGCEQTEGDDNVAGILIEEGSKKVCRQNLSFDSPIIERSLGSPVKVSSPGLESVLKPNNIGMVKGGWFPSLENWWADLRGLSTEGVAGGILSCVPRLSWYVTFKIEGVRVGESAGCGDVLSNEVGIIRAIFSGPTEVKGREFTVLIAMKVALEIFLQSAWRSKAYLIIATDSNLVQRWVSNSFICPCYRWPLLLEIENLLRVVGSVQISFVPKTDFSLAGTLAIDGLNRTNMFKAWCLGHCFDPALLGEKSTWLSIWFFGGEPCRNVPLQKMIVADAVLRCLVGLSSF